MKNKCKLRPTGRHSFFVLFLITIGFCAVIFEISTVPRLVILDTPEIQNWKHVLYIVVPVMSAIAIILGAIANSKINSLQNMEAKKQKVKAEHEKAISDSLKNAMAGAVNIQNIGKGSAGIQNNAPNYGNQTINITTEHRLSDDDKNRILDRIRKLIAETGNSEFTFQTKIGGNSNSIMKQIKDLLIKNGYDLSSSVDGVATHNANGIIIMKDALRNNCVYIFVGNISDILEVNDHFK